MVPGLNLPGIDSLGMILVLVGEGLYVLSWGPVVQRQSRLHIYAILVRVAYANSLILWKVKRE
jgi:hypothetical protein